MDTAQFFGVAPWVVVTVIVTWAGAAWKYRDQRAEKREERKQAKADKDAATALEVEKHRDEMILTLLATVKEENERALTELAEVREENRALRSLEQHFYQFKQAIEHLEAVLEARDDTGAYAVAERNAKAFLARVKRVEQAKGNIQNEIQVVESASRLEERDKE